MMKFLLVVLGVVLFGLVYAGSAAAACPDGSPADDPALTCDDNTNLDFEGLGGNDTMTVTNTGTPGFMGGDGNGLGGSLAGDGGHDNLTNNGAVTGNIVGDLVTGNGGNDTITNNGTVSGIIHGDDATGNGGSDVITNNGTVTGGILGDLATGNGGNDTITNNGTVSGIIHGDDPLGIGGNDVITNNGTVTGNIQGDDAVPIGGNDTIINNGTVTVSISGEAGDDVVIIRVGSTVGGDIDGGPHTVGDTITFTNVDAAAQAAINLCLTPSNCDIVIGATTYRVRNFETLLAILVAQVAQGGGEVIIGDTAITVRAPQEICQGKVKVFRLPNGDLEVYSGFDALPPNGFLVAVIPLAQQTAGGTFSNPAAPVAGWTAVLDASDGRIRVYDAVGNLVSEECRTR